MVGPGYLHHLLRRLIGPFSSVVVLKKHPPARPPTRRYVLPMKNPTTGSSAGEKLPLIGATRLTLADPGKAHRLVMPTALPGQRSEAGENQRPHGGCYLQCCRGYQATPGWAVITTSCLPAPFRVIGRRLETVIVTRCGLTLCPLAIGAHLQTRRMLVSPGRSSGPVSFV